MLKIFTTLLINLIPFVIFSQNIKLTKQDFQTYKNIESGDFPNDFYLKAIFEKKISDSSVIELQKKWGGLDDEFYKGLIQSLINKNHNGLYKTSHYFTSFNFTEFKSKHYFYQSTSLYENNELFIWGTYGKDDSDIEIYSAIGNHLELGAYTATFKTINNFDYVIFESDEQTAVIPMEGNNAFTVKYDVEEFKKTGTYRKCLLTCDSCIQCVRTQYIGETDQVKIQQRVFTSELLVDDIDNDGIIDLYWFAVSNRKLIKYESYILHNGELTLSKKDLKKLIAKTARFKEIEKISTLKQIPNV